MCSIAIDIMKPVANPPNRTRIQHHMRDVKFVLSIPKILIARENETNSKTKMKQIDFEVQK